METYQQFLEKRIIDHSRHPSAEFKYEILRCCFELGKDVEYVRI